MFSSRTAIVGRSRPREGRISNTTDSKIRTSRHANHLEPGLGGPGDGLLGRLLIFHGGFLGRLQRGRVGVSESSVRSSFEGRVGLENAGRAGGTGDADVMRGAMRGVMRGVFDAVKVPREAWFRCFRFESILNFALF